MISRLSKRFLSLAFRPVLRQPLVFRRFDTIRIQPKYRLEFTCTAQIEKGLKIFTKAKLKVLHWCTAIRPSSKIEKFDLHRNKGELDNF